MPQGYNRLRRGFADANAPGFGSPSVTNQNYVIKASILTVIYFHLLDGVLTYYKQATTN